MAATVIGSSTSGPKRRRRRLTGDDERRPVPARPVPATEDDWRDAVDGVLKGRPFEKVLVNQTAGGLDIQPLYAPASTEPILPVDPHRAAYGWDIRQRHEATSPSACQAAVLDDLEHGVTSIELGTPATAWGLDELRDALEGVLLDIAPVVLAPHTDLGSARALVDLLDERGDALTSRCWLGLDPIGAYARSHRVGASTRSPNLPRRSPTRTRTSLHARSTRPGTSMPAPMKCRRSPGCSPPAWRCFDRSKPPAFRSSGPLPPSASGLLRMPISSSRSPGCERPDPCGVRYSPPVESTPTRRVPCRHVAGDVLAPRCGGEHAPLDVGGVRRWCGGADSVTVLPFDGSDSTLARRNARNIHHLLIEESGVNRLVDPAAGSGFVESLTDRLCEAAWSTFQQVEADGGMVVALESGAVETAIDAAWSARLERLATRKESVTGVSEFPDDAPGAVIPEPVDGFPVRRPAAPFEALRDAADRARKPAVAGRSPRGLGSLADHTARSTWITNFLAVGGLDAIGGDADGAASAADAVAAFEQAGASVAVLCSSDPVYAELAAPAATA